LIADCRLIGYRSLPNQKEPQATTHFTARVRLSQQPAQVPTTRPLTIPTSEALGAKDIYKVYFHGPAYQVVEQAWWNGRQVFGLFANNLPANHYPPELPAIIEPRLIELCFQTAGVWELGLHSRMGLPQHVREVSLLRAPTLADGRLYAVVTPDAVHASFDAEVLDEKGNCYLRVLGYQTVALPDSVDPKRLKNLQTILSGEAILVA
jgi:hypothetical protein